ncbi:MAG: hypothetical protein EPN48_18535 [Microbacteriaceae bacterium]|nr:MAG: hypothetical protein EPN48_18535 [Microbacteriaceae bacterium]
MANPCSNIVVVLGDPQRLRSFRKRAASQRLPDGSTAKPPRVFNFHAFVPMPLELAQSRSVERLTWALRYWGTKGHATRASLCDNTLEDIPSLLYSFETPWSPPIPIITEASRAFPDLILELSYAEPGTKTEGRLCYQAGRRNNALGRRISQAMWQARLRSA